MAVQWAIQEVDCQPQRSSCDHAYATTRRIEFVGGVANTFINFVAALFYEAAKRRKLGRLVILVHLDLSKVRIKILERAMP